MSGFFGFDTAMPDDRRAHQGSGFQAGAEDNFDFSGLGGAGEEEDLAVYQWGDASASLLEGNDDLNDETFGGAGDFGNDFNFGAPAPAPSKRGPVASTRSHFGPKAQVDLFAATEDDFYSSRPAPKKSNKTTKPKRKEPEPLWAQASPANAWGAAPSKPAHAQSSSISRPPQHILSIDEIEAEMARSSLDQGRPQQAPQQQQRPPQQVLSLEEIEQQMVQGIPTPPLQNQRSTPQIPTPHQPTPPPQSQPQTQQPPSQQALLDSMFPGLGEAPPPATQPVPQQQQQQQQQLPPPLQPSPEELARMEERQRRIQAKIEDMSKYNNLMGNSDKDFITRIQLSQLATADPYSSDFYAQVYSALVRRQQAAGDTPAVVNVGAGLGFGVGAPTGNRFGKMGNASMQRLTTQVKKLIATTAKRQANNMSNDALQGALGRVRRGPSQVAPRPVLAVPAPHKSQHRPIAQLNQSDVTSRPALTRKQVMYALEELYDDVLDIEQMRRDAPPPTDVPRVEAWNAACATKVEGMWRKLMVMEPLGVSNPHPFISLLNPTKGHRLFPRLLRHLPHQQALTLLTLLIATYPQLDVVARAPPPPVADASLLTKADRLDRAQREAETDSFLQYVVPGVDALINQCNLGLVSGLIGICIQRMEAWKVASTRPGVALFTALLSRAQSLLRSQDAEHLDPAEVDQWNKTFAYFLQSTLPHLPELFPLSQAQKAAFGPGAYLLDSQAEQHSIDNERREAEVWGFVAALAVNAPEDQQTNLVAALREKILHTVQTARDPHTDRQKAELKLRNVNMFLHGLGLDASMIE